MIARCIRIKKFADTKISGYVWTGPKTQDFQNHTLFSREAVPRGYRSLVYRGVNKAFISLLIRRYSVQYSGTFLVSISLLVFLSIFRNWGEATLKLQSS